MILKSSCIFFIYVSIVYAGLSPIHDMKERMGHKIIGDKYVMNSPHKVMNHLDASLAKSTKNVTENPAMEQTLFQISKDLVSSILSKIEMQDKITRITREALDASGKNKGVTAIETRRILDYISRTLSGHILSITRASTEPELHRLVYGLAQIAAEVSIVSALKDITYATALSKKQSVDLSLRRKRSLDMEPGNDLDYEPDNTEDIVEKRSIDVHPKNAVTTSVSITLVDTTIYNAVLNKTINLASSIAPPPSKHHVDIINQQSALLRSPFSVLPREIKKPVMVINTKKSEPIELKGFLNQTALDIENLNRQHLNESDAIVLQKHVNTSHYEKVESPTLDTQESSAPGLTDEWMDTKETIYKPAVNPDVIAEMEIDRTEMEDEVANQKKMQEKLEKLEVKAKKAILYAGDVAYLTAASVVAMRRALTASIEVQMSVKYAKNGMSNHQDLMMNLAKTAAQQAGKEAKSASSKSLACERVIKLALKYTAQSHGAKLNHVANRIIMDSLSLATLAKSMAFVSSDIAINSLYQATDVRPPVK